MESIQIRPQPYNLFNRGTVMVLDAGSPKEGYVPQLNQTDKAESDLIFEWLG